VSLGPAEILVVLVIALLVFGPKRLPEIGRQVGRAMHEFRKFQGSLKADIDTVFADDSSAHAEPAPTLPPKAIEAAEATGTPDAAVLDVETAEPPSESGGSAPSPPGA
jgi:sec-independent protein translocase protein TatA